MFWNKKKYANGYSTVSVNGKTVRVRGNNISIINDQIIVDGKPLEEALDQPNITVIVEGDCRSLNACGNVEVKPVHYYPYNDTQKLVGFKKLEKPVKLMWFPNYYSDKSIDWHVEHFGSYELETKLPARKEGIKIDEYIDLQKCLNKIEKKHVDAYERWSETKSKGLYMSNYIDKSEIGLSLNSEEYTLPQATRQYVTAHGYWVKD